MQILLVLQQRMSFDTSRFSSNSDYNRAAQSSYVMLLNTPNFRQCTNDKLLAITTKTLENVN